MKQISIGQLPELDYARDEAINTLCTNLSFAGENIKKIMITSCHASEGKTFLSMHIMRTLAKLGKNVVLVDADLRRSVVASRYALQIPEGERAFGLVHWLVGEVGPEEVIYTTNLLGAFMVPVGRTVSTPLPLLVTERFGDLLDYLCDRVDYVLVDAPPVGSVIDGVEIAKSCDGMLLVVDYNSVRRQELIDAKEQLEQTGCPILGTVLNRVEYGSYLNRKYYYKNYYSNYVKEEDAIKKSSKRKKK